MNCIFCGGTEGVKGTTCLPCGDDPKRAAKAILIRVNIIARLDIQKYGAHHRAIQKILKELK